MSGGYLIQNRLSTIFILYMLVLYPLITHDKYYDITLTKYKAFAVGLCIYAVLMVLAVLVDVFDRIDGGGGKRSRTTEADSRKKGIGRYNLMGIDLCMAAFFVASFFAFLEAADKAAAYTGEDGRRCGMQFVLLTFFMYACLGRRYRVRGYEAAAFMITGVITGIIAIFQYAGVDFLHLREGLSDDMAGIYISTFGNIDIYASFLCVMVPVAMGMYVCSRRCWVKVAAGAAICIGMAAVIITNADLAYAGIGAALLVLVLAAFYMGKVKELGDTGVLMALGMFLSKAVLAASGKGFDGLDGFSRIPENTLTIVLFAVLCLAVSVVFRLVPGVSEKVSGGRGLVAAAVIAVAAVVGGIFYISANAGYMLTFDDSWGSYRGFVWKRLLEIYKDFPVHKWIFGNGNESVKALMTENYYDEMVGIVGVIYDNAHNEYLQYLVTTGLLGALPYIGLVVFAIATALKCQTSEMKSIGEDGKTDSASSDGLLLALALGITGYAAQAIFNLNQSLTTPYMFLMIALTAGICREKLTDIRNRELR